MKKIIVHVSEVDITPETGMGRVEYYWKKAFEDAQYEFIHIGPSEINPVKHKSLFGFKALHYFKKLNIKPSAFIVHEPLAGYFVNKGIPCFLESHGVEIKAWHEDYNINKKNLSLFTRIVFPIWRLYMGKRGLRLSDKLLLVNSDDFNFIKKRLHRKNNDMYVFSNGCDIPASVPVFPKAQNFTVLFNASWIERKGIATLTEAANILYNQNFDIKYLLIGTGKQEDEVLNFWNKSLYNSVTVIPKFLKQEECNYLSNASVVVLPSYFEGQPLSLLQAMAYAKCCIATNCCGQKDFIQNGINGFLFEERNASELAKVIEHCYYNPSLVQKIGIEANRSVQHRSWKNVSKQVADYVIAQIT